MVSKARLDLPDPESPVTTINRSRGISTEMFLRLWTRAPWTAMVVRAGAGFELWAKPADHSICRRRLQAAAGERRDLIRERLLNRRVPADAPVNECHNGEDTNVDGVCDSRVAKGLQVICRPMRRPRTVVLAPASRLDAWPGVRERQALTQ